MWKISTQILDDNEKTISVQQWHSLLIHQQLFHGINIYRMWLIKLIDKMEIEQYHPFIYIASMSPSAVHRIVICVKKCVLLSLKSPLGFSYVCHISKWNVVSVNGMCPSVLSWSHWEIIISIVMRPLPTPPWSSSSSPSSMLQSWSYQ